MPETLDPGALAELRDVAGGDAEIYAELLDAFLADADRYLLEMQGTLAPDASAELGRAAHSLKSNAMSVGATRLAELCRDLETAARVGSVPDAPTQVETIAKELDVVGEAVRDARREALDGG
jgi:histidine phosphotransfer protein HptB